MKELRTTHLIWPYSIWASNLVDSFAPKFPFKLLPNKSTVGSACIGFSMVNILIFNPLFPNSDILLLRDYLECVWFCALFSASTRRINWRNLFHAGWAWGGIWSTWYCQRDETQARHGITMAKSSKSESPPWGGSNHNGDHWSTNIIKFVNFNSSFLLTFQTLFQSFTHIPNIT